MVALGNSQRAPSQTPSQFHIQTDQGKERFFQFKTDSGQYRKETRHADGSVTGTYGWVDSTGLLRLFDYISDSGGYRIERQREYQVGKPDGTNRLIKVPLEGHESNYFGIQEDNNLLSEPEFQAPRVHVPRKAEHPPPPPNNVFVGHAPNYPLGHFAHSPFFRVPQYPFIVHQPILVVQPPPEPEPEPEPEPFVIGSRHNTLPPPPKYEGSNFVIGAAANGETVTRRIGSRRRPHVVGAAGSEQSHSRNPAPSRTVIGEARGKSIPEPTPQKAPRRSGFVIGLRHDNRRKRSFYLY